MAVLGLVALSGLAAGCGGGGGGGGGDGGPFVVLKTEPANNGQIFLNQSLKIFLSNRVDIGTANFNSVVFAPFTLGGQPVAETVTGFFKIGRNERGEVDPTVLEFVPNLPTNDTYTNGGFRPGRQYLVSLVGDNSSVAPTLRDMRGRSLSRLSPIQTMVFRTASGTTPQELFLDVRPGGPRVVGSFDVGPKDASDRVILNRLGDVPVEVTLRFNQPLNPASGNIPLRQNPDPAQFLFREQGKIFLEYDDKEFGKNRWIPCQVEVTENTPEGATVILRPDAVLPNAAEVRVIVEADLEDISGESNVKDASYIRLIGSFRTEDAFDTLYDATTFSFAAGGILDPEAPFRDPVAEVGSIPDPKDPEKLLDVLTASFDFEGLDRGFDFVPSKSQKEVILRTDVTRVQPRNGPPITVKGGIFKFENIEIPSGVRVRGVGPNPIVFLVRGSVTIEGSLVADGGNGEDVFSLNAGNVPTKGGTGECGAGDGGRASLSTQASTGRGETGLGPGGKPNAGGQGGQIGCGNASGKGAGGGGGSHTTEGDPTFYGGTVPNPKPTVNGIGGAGGNGASNGAGGVPAGGVSGPLVFIDEDPNNNFWGRQVDATGRVIVGELINPLAGAGGGGGGDVTAGQPGVPCDAGVNFINDKKGGGGGGGGGVLIIKALGPITIKKNGLISANGGDGGGGQDAGGCKFGGGGGGGSGGMVILMSADKIEIETHVRRYASPDWDPNFAILADGGIGHVLNTQGVTARTQKYPGLLRANSGESNRGGFGGMGVVQLMAPPGDDQIDKTGSVQDDNIIISDPNTGAITGKAKTDWINNGDIRPQPILMPVPFSRYSQARTRWVATGSGLSGGPVATVRREADTTRNASERLARTINTFNGGLSGPEYFFWGLETDGNSTGYVRVDKKTGLVASRTELTANVRVLRPAAKTLRGRTVHVVEAVGSPFPKPDVSGGFSFANHLAVLRNGTNVVGSFRIVDHTTSELYFDSSESLPSSATAVDIRASFFEVFTGLSGTYEPGLGPTFDLPRGQTVEKFPIANMQIGFAFHEDPARPDLSTAGEDQKRWPRKLDEFVYDLDLGNDSLRELIRKLHYPFVKLQVRFNLDYNPDNPNTGNPFEDLKPSTKRTALRLLFLPYRF